MAIYLKFPNIKGTDVYSGYFKGVCRESIIVQLHNFIILHDEMIKDPQIKKIDDSLTPLIKPILELRVGIKQLRHNYIAHIQEKGKPFDIQIQEIIDKHQIPNTFGHWLYLSGCFLYYFGFLIRNMREEYGKSQKKYGALQPLNLDYGTINLQNYMKELRKSYEETKQLLTSNNLDDFCAFNIHERRNG